MSLDPGVVLEILTKANAKVSGDALARTDERLASGVSHCECPCHKTIEQGGGRPGICPHCQVLGAR